MARGRQLSAVDGPSRPVMTGAFFNDMLHILRAGCPWRDMHERYRKWNSVEPSLMRWEGGMPDRSKFKGDRVFERQER